eukprot:TRINITY_DN3062_c0_g1_i3.p1 TRINITY_DN3062_c0_g1~~TRINITY_DN3062_c0_g1_i3.p1  ORF type:complete len:413 (-),score=83.89 TRINITY_DN3062_c0_g1_i3:113-1351(-)
MEKEREKKCEREKYHSAICDICEFPIVGIRYKCLNCKDYDICQFCEEIYLELRAHSIQHVFLKIKNPLPEVEERPNLLFPNLYSGKMDCECEEWTQPSQDTQIIHEGLLCNSCSHPIIGYRFKCTQCSNYNLCETCESKNNHDKSHIFVKIRFSLPSKKELDIRIPELYNEDDLHSSTESIRLDKSSDSQIKLSSSTSSLSSGLRNSSNRRKPREDKQNNPSDLGSFEVTIREMKMNEVDSVYEIEEESFFSPYDKTFFYNFPRSHGRFLLVAVKESDSEVGGYLAFHVKESKKQIEVVSIAVRSNSRRYGIGKKLMNHMISVFVPAFNVSKVVLHVSVMNFAAQNLYKSLGFEMTQWINKYYSDENEDALLLILNLNKQPSSLSSSSSSISGTSTNSTTKSLADKIISFFN